MQKKRHIFIFSEYTETHEAVKNVMKISEN